ncbi:MAG TPA: hypothetical protein VMP01_19075 [Pirellulaceae bacterium]|nr:hypothetical protein [Pirellulaceae bacterium]
MQTQLSILKAHMERGDHAAAIRLASGWARLGDAKTAIRRAAAALTTPDTYRALGYDPDALVAEAARAIRERYGLRSK